MKQKILELMTKSGAFAPFRFANRNGALILMYHRFSREKHASRTSQNEFETHLKYLIKHYKLISLQQLADNLRKGEKPVPKTAVITIDDGYADAYEIAFPILKRFNLPATLFVMTDFLDRKNWLWTDKARFLAANTKISEFKKQFGEVEKTYLLHDKNSRSETASRLNSWLKTLSDEQKDFEINLLAEKLEVKLPELPPVEFGAITWEQAREMDKNGLAIESHTVSHPILPNLASEKIIEFELCESKRRIEAELNREINLFCYPNGNFDNRARQIAEKVGYKCAVTTKCNLNFGTEDIFLLNRISAENNFAHFVQSTSGFETAKNRLRKLF